MQGHQHGTVRHSSSKEVIHPVCKNARSAASSLHHQLSWLWHPFPPPSGERTPYKIFFPRFSRAGSWVFLNALTIAGDIPQGLSLTFEPLFYRSFDLLHTKGWCNILQSCQKKQVMFPDAFLLPPCLQPLKSQSVLERPGCEDYFWPDGLTWPQPRKVDSGSP